MIAVDFVDIWELLVSSNVIFPNSVPIRNSVQINNPKIEVINNIDLDFFKFIINFLPF